MSDIILNKIKGSIFAAAIGDALGGPLEIKTLDEIEDIYGKRRIDDLIDYNKTRPQGGNLKIKKGTYTDDTRLRNLLCDTIIKKNTRITAYDFAENILQNMDPTKYWPGEQIVYSKLILWQKMRQYKNIKNLTSHQAMDVSSPKELGQGNIPACDMAMCISPIGLLTPGEPGLAAKDAYDVGSVIQSGYSLGGAICVACATSEAMNPNSNIDKIIDTSLKYSDGPLKSVLNQTMDYIRANKDISAFKEWFYNNMLTGFVDVLEVVPAVIGIIYLKGENINEALIEAANFGRDCDSIATNVGSILGALHGLNAINKDWIQTVMAANPEPDLNDLSQKLYEAFLNEVSIKKEYLKHIETYL